MAALSAPVPDDEGRNEFSFENTHWSVVFRAREINSPQAADALDRLCNVYWKPLYLFVRRSGYGVEEAQDLTQEFFRLLLEKNWLRHLTHQNGKFRCFLLTFLKNFLADQRAWGQAQKRGGGKQILSLDELEAEERDRHTSAESLTPDEAFDRKWAMTILENAFAHLKAEYEAAGKAQLFEKIKNSSSGGRGENYAQIAADLGMTESALTSAAHRFRQRYSRKVREEISHTVQRAEEVDEEIRNMMAVLSR